MSVTSIRLQEDLEQSLAELAKKTDRSKNWIINQAIKDYIDKQELEEKLWLETLPAIESVRSGKTIPAESIDDWVSSWGTSTEMDAPDL